MNMNWNLAHLMGLDDASGYWYLWWSGIGGQLALIGAAFGMYRKHACHIYRCFRIGKHRVEGTPFVVCRKHHPGIPNRVTVEHVDTGSSGES